MFEEMINFVTTFLNDVGNLTTVLITELDFGFFKFTPLGLVTIGGLLTYLGVAVVKWLAS